MLSMFKRNNCAVMALLVLVVAMTCSSAVVEAAAASDATPPSVNFVPRRPAGCRPSLADPRVCLLRGATVYYRNRLAVKRSGVWYKSKTSAVKWSSGKWVRARVVRHPTDPRYVRVAGRWVRRSRAGKKLGAKYVRRGALWWRSAALRRFYSGGRWRKPYWLQRANSPNYRKLGGRWVKRRANARGAVLWNGLWRRGKVAYWQGRWRPLGKVIGGDPNLKKQKKTGKWANTAYTRASPYVIRYGRWFRKGTNMVFRGRKWVRYGRVHNNDPRYRRTRRGRWARVKGAGRAFQRRGNTWYRPGNRVFRNGRWISATRYRALARGKDARRVLARGELPSGMRSAVKAQVKVNFSRFIKWFISNYLRGGNNLNAAKRIETAAIRVTDAFNPQPYEVKAGAPEALGASTRGPPPTASWLIDAAVRESSRRPGTGKAAVKPTGIAARSTIHYAEMNARGKAGVFGVRSDDVSNNRAVQAASFLASSSESDDSSNADNDGGDDNDDDDDNDGATVGAEREDSVGTNDPSLPAQLNGGDKIVSASSDPSMAG
jgi:hypothetical protein